MLLRDETLWVIFRDDVPVPDDARLVDFVAKCLAAYKKKLGIKPTQLGISKSFPAGAEQTISGMGVRVVRFLPAWSRDEVWVGGGESALIPDPSPKGGREFGGANV